MGIPGAGDMLGIGDIGGIEGGIDVIGGIDGLFIGMFGSAIIFFMSASMDLQQSGCAE
jgi:hypothetical protein